MHLYNKNNNIVEVYDFTARKEDLTSYRRELMKEIPICDRTIYIDTKVNLTSNPLLEKYLNNECLINGLFDWTEIDNKSLNSGFHIFLADNRNVKNSEKLVEQYIRGTFDKKIAFDVRYSDLIKYYLLC